MDRFLKYQALAVFLLWIALWLWVLPAHCFARDFIVRFVEENYRETRQPFSYAPIIYHSIQVQSPAGPKLLLLQGDDGHYRTWIRQYIAENKDFILKVPDDAVDDFLSASLFKADIKDLHPLDLDRYQASVSENKKSPDRYGDFRDSERPGADGKENARTASQEAARRAALLIEQKKQAAAVSQEEKEAALAAEEKRRQESADAEAAAREAQRALDDEARARQLEAQQAFYAAQLAERERESAQREKVLEARWQALRMRLMRDDRIRKMEQAERELEIARRWYEVRRRLEF